MIICITGMHRSGTSLTASWLESCGLTIHDGAFWGPSVGNPRGHFEDKGFVRLHASAIRRERPKSKGWKIFARNFLTFNDEHLARAHDLVDERKARYDVWSWKDPRSVLFLEHWKAILPELKALLVWRPCTEVVHSLIRRSRKATQANLKVTLLESVKLWVRYNERVCEYKQQHPDDALLLPLEYIVGYDQTVLNLLNERFQVDLRYNPIRNLYDPALLQRGSIPLLVRLVSRLYKSSEVENRLQALSDLQPVNHQP
jgi:hypothetical protein